MKKWIVLIDNYETFITDDETEAYKMYNYFRDMKLPVALYECKQFSNIHTKQK